MKKQKLDRKRPLAWRAAATTVLLGAGIYVLTVHRQTVLAGVRVAQHANGAWIVLSLLLMMLTFCIAATTYRMLALHSVRYREILLVEIAAAFIGRLLPAGLGGLGLNGLFWYRHRHSPAEATVVISVNNLLGMCAHGVLLVGVLLLDTKAIRPLIHDSHLSIPWVWVGVLLVLLLGGCLLPAVRSRLMAFGRNLLVSVRKERISCVAVALLFAILLTLAYTLLLACSARSIGITLSLVQIFIVFSIGMLIGTATPTPGGLVGAEAGLFAGFIAYGISTADAGAAVLIFRLVTYWLPLLPGLGAFLTARKYRIV